MSLITRCPACETMFKVVPDQLRISEGWVRCGQCNEIFDASVHLQERELPGHAEVAKDGPQVMLSHDDLDADQGADELDTEPDDDVRTGLPHAREPELREPEQHEAEPDELEVSGADDIDEKYEPVEHWGEAELESTVPDAGDAHTALPEQVEPIFTQALPAYRSSKPDISFLRQTRPRSVWRRPLVRLGLGLLSLMLVLGLTVQVIVHERDRIAATEPVAKPWVQAVCAVLACSVSPLRQIESMVIDSSSFNRLRGDTYRLNFTLKNTALTELATPAIELTLTDPQDRALMRRVFTPAEVGLPSRVLAPGSESNGSLAISVKTAGTNERVAGYRVLAFYP